MLQLSYRALFLFLLGLLLIITTIFGGPARGSTVSDIAAACEDGYTLWANAEGDDEGDDDDGVDRGDGDDDEDWQGLRWTGGANSVEGGVHSNNDIVFYTSFNSVNGPLRFVDNFYNFGLGNSFSSPQEVTADSAPVFYDLNDYRPGGRLASAAQAQGRYHFINGRLEIQSSSVVLDGLYYVTDNVEISSNNLSGTVTIVSEERIEISGQGHDLVADSDGLLFYAADRGGQSLDLDGDDSQYQGIVFTEGDIRLDGSNSDYYGALVAEAINIAGDFLNVHFEGAYCPGGAGATSTPPPVPSSTVTPTITPTPTPTATGMPVPMRFDRFLPLAALGLDQGPGEPNNGCEQAFGLVIEVPYFFLAEDPEDWYQFVLDQPGNLTIQLTNFVPEDGQAALYRGPDCGSLTFLRNNGNKGPDKSMALGPQPAGRYFLFVSNDGAMNTSHPYRLEVEISP